MARTLPQAVIASRIQNYRTAGKGPSAAAQRSIECLNNIDTHAVPSFRAPGGVMQDLYKKFMADDVAGIQGWLTRLDGQPRVLVPTTTDIIWAKIRACLQGYIYAGGG